ncbi:MAG: spore maturation protein A [Clostridiaceae bacterium]|nr:spore maturation protein A [Clostridiaceae bacterium]
MLDKIWVFILLISVIFGFISGKAGELGSAAINGAGQAVTLVIGLTGALCFWQGMMAVMRECGAAAALARVLRRPVGLLMKKTRENARAMEAVCANISANLLGLANAATPFGIEAAKALSDGGETANDDLCMLVVINSASLQLIPSTVAALRASLGSAAPYDILPCVWLTTLVSQATGIAAALLLAKIQRNTRAASPLYGVKRSRLPLLRKKSAR